MCQMMHCSPLHTTRQLPPQWTWQRARALWKRSNTTEKLSDQKLLLQARKLHMLLTGMVFSLRQLWKTWCHRCHHVAGASLNIPDWHVWVWYASWILYAHYACIWCLLCASKCISGNLFFLWSSSHCQNLSHLDYCGKNPMINRPQVVNTWNGWNKQSPFSF